eukprot:scaffold647_cov150-Skeletonema_menzelii.AAC.16
MMLLLLLPSPPRNHHRPTTSLALVQACALHQVIDSPVRGFVMCVLYDHTIVLGYFWWLGGVFGMMGRMEARGNMYPFYQARTVVWTHNMNIDNEETMMSSLFQ